MLVLSYDNKMKIKVWGAKNDEGPQLDRGPFITKGRGQILLRDASKSITKKRLLIPGKWEQYRETFLPRNGMLDEYSLEKRAHSD